MDAERLDRLRSIADDIDREASALYRKASGGGICASADQGDATAKRKDAEFLRKLADDLEDE